MDTPERRILRRKRQLLATKFKLSEKYERRFREEVEIPESTWEIVQGETSSAGRVGRFVDLYPATPESFDFLCELLDEEYEFLADDLRAEIKVERDELEIEEYISKESNMLIDREFGHSKRLTDAEKAELSVLLAKRTQCAKEVWQRQLSKAWKSLERVRKENVERDEQISTLIYNVSRFLRIHQSRVKDADPKDFEDPDLVGIRGQQLLEILESKINLATLIMNKILDDKKQVEEEKDKTLYLLKIKDKNAKLELAVQKAIEEAKAKLRKAEKEAKESGMTGEGLNQEINRLRNETHQETSQYDKSVIGMSTHLKTCQKRVKELEGNLQTLRRELRAALSERGTYQEKAELLMRHRTLGYLSEKERSSLSLDAPGINLGPAGGSGGGSGASGTTAPRGSIAGSTGGRSNSLAGDKKKVQIKK